MGPFNTLTASILEYTHGFFKVATMSILIVGGVFKVATTTHSSDSNILLNFYT